MAGITDLVISPNTSDCRWLLAISPGQKKLFFTESRCLGIRYVGLEREGEKEREREEREKNRMCGLLDKRGLGERETAWLVITESPRATSLAIMMQLKLAVISLILADMADGICLEPLGIFFTPLPPFFFSFLFFNGPATGIETRMCPLEIDVRRRAGSLMPPINATAQLRGSQYCAVAASLSKAKSDTRERCF